MKHGIALFFALFATLAAPAHAALGGNSTVTTRVFLCCDSGNAATQQIGPAASPGSLADSRHSGYVDGGGGGIKGTPVTVTAARADTNWLGGELRALAAAQVTSPCPTVAPLGCSAPGTLEAEATAHASIQADDLSFGGGGAPFTTSLNLGVAGIVTTLANIQNGDTLSSYQADSARDATVHMRFSLTQAQPTVNPDNPNGPLMNVTHTLAFGDIDMRFRFDGGNTLTYSGLDGASVPSAWNAGHWENGSFVVTTKSFLVYTDRPASLYFEIGLDTGTQYSVHGQDTVGFTLDFAHSFGIAPSGPVLNGLPGGISVTSADLRVAGNQLAPVPLPASAWLLGGALLVGWRGRARSRG